MPQPPGIFVDWTPEKVEIRCDSDRGCPPQVGLVFFVEPPVNRMHKFHRCTAFLISPTQIMSNGHCDHFKEANGYFVTAVDSTVGRQMRRITGIVAKRFTPHPNPQKRDKDSGRPDVALFNLDSPINMPGLELATLKDPPYEMLYGFVINPAPKNSFTIGRIECNMRRHEATFPFNIQENPDVLTGFGCFARPGNSGGPMFTPGSPKVQAVVQGGGDPSSVAAEVRDKYNRSLYNYENHWIVRATNVRCLNAAAGRCVEASIDTANARFIEFRDKAYRDWRGPAPVQFNEWAEVVPPR